MGTHNLIMLVIGSFMAGIPASFAVERYKLNPWLYVLFAVITAVFVSSNIPYKIGFVP